MLEDDRARGYVRRVEFVDLAGWTLTEVGRTEDERRLAAELALTGARPVVQAGADDFVGLNARLLTAITDWQLRPQPWDRLAANDHTDHRWDDRVLRELTRIGELLAPVCDPLAAALSRFEGYPQRYAAAMARVAWVGSSKSPRSSRGWKPSAFGDTINGSPAATYTFALDPAADGRRRRAHRVQALLVAHARRVIAYLVIGVGAS